MPKEFLIDLHCHTKERSHDGRLSAVEVLRAALANGWSGVTFTDHNNPWPEEELEELRRSVPLPEGFFLASGQEVRTIRNGITWGDLLVFGPTESIADGADPVWVCDRARQCKGFTLSAHPGARGGLGEHLGELPVLGAEVWNGRYGEQAARESQALADRFGITPFGGSDTHRESDLGGGATIVPRVPTSLADLAEMLRNGETKAWRPTILNKMKRMWPLS